MDNVTHTLFGLTLARTRLGRHGPDATIALILASNAPDVDIVATAGGATKYLEWHRGWTHGPVGAIGLAIITAALVVSARRAWDRRRPMAIQHAEGRASFSALAVISFVAVVCHVLMDVPTSYGVRMFAPFDWHWYTTDWMPIVDLYLLVALAAGLLYGRGSADARRRNVAIVFMLIAALYATRAVAHHEALALAPRVFGPSLPAPCAGAPAGRPLIARWPGGANPEGTPDGERCLLDVAALPTFISPFDWRLIVQTSSGYALQDISLLDRRLRADETGSRAPWRMSIRVPNQWTADVFRASSTAVAQVFLGFSRFPAARALRARDGSSMVQWTDLRFLDVLGRAGGSARNSLFTATIRFDSGGRVTETHLGPSR